MAVCRRGGFAIAASPVSNGNATPAATAFGAGRGGGGRWRDDPGGGRGGVGLVMGVAVCRRGGFAIAASPVSNGTATPAATAFGAPPPSGPAAVAVGLAVGGGGTTPVEAALAVGLAMGGGGLSPGRFCYLQRHRHAGRHRLRGATAFGASSGLFGLLIFRALLGASNEIGEHCG